MSVGTYVGLVPCFRPGIYNAVFADFFRQTNNKTKYCTKYVYTLHYSQRIPEMEEVQVI